MNNHRRKGDLPQDDTHLLVSVLPAELHTTLHHLPLDQLLEVILDLGRYPEARFPDRVVRLAEKPVTHEDLAHVLALVGEFSDDNRAGIERTLHRISCIRNRKGHVIGLTLRVGRALFGTIELLRDLIATGNNVLMLGRPGVGKTTKLREMARVLADDLHKRVVIVDTSNEIAGDGDIPHSGIGSARRMQVPKVAQQHAVMIEAVENHMPEVIIVDEIGTEAEAVAARTIAERGVQLIGTAHGNTLENLVMNPTLSDLVGGVQTVTLSDEEARHRGTTKTVNERKSPPTFDILVELVGRHEVLIHKDTAGAVDKLLRGYQPKGEQRRQSEDGTVEIKETAPEKAAPALSFAERPVSTATPRAYLHGVSRELTERTIRELGLDLRLTARPEQADLVLALRSRAEDLGLKRLVRLTNAPVHMIKRNSSSEIRRLLQKLFNVVQGVEEEEIQETVQETEEAIRRVLAERIEVALAPRGPTLRKMQHRMISGHGLAATSIGREPERHLVIGSPEPGEDEEFWLGPGGGNRDAPPA